MTLESNDDKSNKYVTTCILHRARFLPLTGGSKATTNDRQQFYIKAILLGKSITSPIKSADYNGIAQFDFEFQWQLSADNYTTVTQKGVVMRLVLMKRALNTKMKDVQVGYLIINTRQFPVSQQWFQLSGVKKNIAVPELLVTIQCQTEQISQNIDGEVMADSEQGDDLKPQVVQDEELEYNKLQDDEIDSRGEDILQKSPVPSSEVELHHYRVSYYISQIYNNTGHVGHFYYYYVSPFSYEVVMSLPPVEIKQAQTATLDEKVKAESMEFIYPSSLVDEYIKSISLHVYLYTRDPQGYQKDQLIQNELSVDGSVLIFLSSIVNAGSSWEVDSESIPFTRTANQWYDIVQNGKVVASLNAVISLEDFGIVDQMSPHIADLQNENGILADNKDHELQTSAVNNFIDQSRDRSKREDDGLYNNPTDLYFNDLEKIWLDVLQRRKAMDQHTVRQLNEMLQKLEQFTGTLELKCEKNHQVVKKMELFQKMLNDDQAQNRNEFESDLQQLKADYVHQSKIRDTTLKQVQNECRSIEVQIKDLEKLLKQLNMEIAQQQKAISLSNVPQLQQELQIKQDNLRLLMIEKSDLQAEFKAQQRQLDELSFLVHDKENSLQLNSDKHMRVMNVHNQLELFSQDLQRSLSLVEHDLVDVTELRKEVDRLFKTS
ncbi:hypothetical protein MP228_012881 [Amoeboaphelidium protococcarum]|nr:hypothetical protein MP228_012881 [Amoeboaphelidium protococcarum]